MESHRVVLVALKHKEVSFILKKERINKNPLTDPDAGTV
jgi:hypothetical protein